MIPVTQTQEGWPYGDCVRASYAALLGIQTALIPRFDPAALAPGESQRERERQWLASLGIRLVEIEAPPGKRFSQALLDEVPPVFHLISGLSPRGLGHRCVGFAGRVLHDPHPSRAGLLTVYSVGFLVPQ